MKRTFIAIKVPLSDDIKDIIDDVKFELMEEKIKWVEEWNMHITLFFLGETDFYLIDKVKEKLFLEIAKINSFQLSINKLGIFKNLHDPKVIWLGLMQSKSLLDLKRQVDDIMISLGISAERKYFNPHLTLGRTKFLKDKVNLKSLLDKYREFESVRIQVNKVYFFESVLTPKGPQYNIISEIELA